MKNSFIFLFVAFITTFNVNAQFKNKKIINIADSLKKVKLTDQYQEKHSALMHLGIYYQYYKGDSAVLFFTKAADLARSYKDPQNLYEALGYLSLTARQTVGNYPLSLSAAIESMKIASTINLPDSRKNWYKQNLAQSYAQLHNKKMAIQYINIAWPIAERESSKFNSFELARTYFLINEFDSSYKYIKMRVIEEEKLPFAKRWSAVYIGMGDVFRIKNSYDSAIEYYKKSILYSSSRSNKKDYLEANSDLASIYFQLNQIDSSIHYGYEVINYSQDSTYKEGLLNAFEILYQSYKKINRIDSSFKYIEKYKELFSQLDNSTKINEAQNIALSELAKLKEVEEERQLQQRKLYITSIVLIFIVFGVYIYGKRRQRAILKKSEDSRKDKELQAAKDLQLSLLPRENPKRDDLDIATFIRSSTEVGGDYYDFAVEKDGTIISICGDATGHGVASGMMVSVTKAALKGIGIENPSIALQKLNNIVKEINLGKLRMSLSIARISQKQIEFASAAMPPVYLFKSKTSLVEEIMIEGLPLGGLKNISFDAITRNFESGDVLIQLSDGLPEAPNTKGEMYDYDRLKSLIQDSCHLSAQEIINTLIQSVDQWLEGKHNPDDITIVVTKKK